MEYGGLGTGSILKKSSKPVTLIVDGGSRGTKDVGGE